MLSSEILCVFWIWRIWSLCFEISISNLVYTSSVLHPIVILGFIALWRNLLASVCQIPLSPLVDSLIRINHLQLVQTPDWIILAPGWPNTGQGESLVKSTWTPVSIENYSGLCFYIFLDIKLKLSLHIRQLTRCTSGLIFSVIGSLWPTLERKVYQI